MKSPWKPILDSNFTLFLAAILSSFFRLYSFTLRMASSNYKPNIGIPKKSDPRPGTA